MSDVKWIKIVTDIFDDEKILLIETLPEADSIIVIWFKLLCLAGRQNNSGVFQLNGRIPYTDEMFATVFRRKINTIRLALKTFEQYGMIEIINGTVTIPNWSKHQTLDRIERNREYMNKYMRKRRDEQRMLAEGTSNDDETGCKPNCKTNSKTNCKTNCKTNSKPNVSGADKKRVEKNRVEKNREEAEAAGTATAANPFGDDVYEQTDEDKLVAYASSNLQYLSPNNVNELISFRDALPDDIITYAIDEACAAGIRRYAYVRSILNRYAEAGYKSIGDVKADDAKRQKRDTEPKEYADEDSFYLG